MENLQEKSGSELANVSLDARLIEKCDFRAKTTDISCMLKTAKDQRPTLLEKDMQKILETAAKYLQEKLPLKNSRLYCVRCLNPSLRKELYTKDTIMSLVPLMPQVSASDTSFSDSF